MRFVSQRGIKTIRRTIAVAAVIFTANVGAALAQSFIVPAVGTVVQLKQVTKGFKDVRETWRVTGVAGDVVSLHVEGSENGQQHPATDVTKRFLVFEDGRMGEDTNNCKITAGLEHLFTLETGAQVVYETQCSLVKNGEVYYTATSHVQRTIVGPEKITVAAGTFDTVVVEDVSDVDLVLKGKEQPQKRKYDRFWFAPSLGYYVKSTFWDATGSPYPNSPTWEAWQVHSGDDPDGQMRTSARPDPIEPARSRPKPKKQRVRVEAERSGPATLDCTNPAGLIACANHALSTLPVAR
jgi:hypothetical protein